MTLLGQYAKALESSNEAAEAGVRTITVTGEIVSPKVDKRYFKTDITVTESSTVTIDVNSP